ncbi:MAG: hypothetical protein HKO03_08260 [Acidimicrobiia bacterium]|nr:hypothetical protein [Acidimicrobiia bacterium]
MTTSPSIAAPSFPARMLMVLLLAILAVGFAVGPVVSAASATEESEQVEVTEEEGENFEGIEPAVIVESEGGPEIEPAWTFRYLVPTFLVLMLLGVGVTVLRWIRMRSKYKIVE